MEGINSQIGQPFAGVSSNSVNRVDGSSEQSLQRTGRAPQTENLAENSSTVEQQGTVDAQLQRFSETSTSSQESAQTADTTNSEQRNDSLDLEDATREIEQFLQSQNRNLAFSVDENTDRSVVTVTESGSGDVIRQIPSEEVLRLAERLDDLRTDVGSSVGVLFNNQV